MQSPYDFNCVQHGDKKKPALFFLHGFMGSCRDWTNVIARFSDKYLCVAVDLPGHGKTVVSGGAASFRMRNCAAGLVDFIDALDIGKCNIVGYSMGGRLAMYLAVYFPSRFERVIIESASPGLKTRDERRARIVHDMSLARRLKAEPFDRFLQKWYEQPLFASIKENRKRFQQLLERRLDNNKTGLALSLRMMGTGAQPSLWQALDKVNIPLCLIAGEEDDKFKDIGREVVSKCKTAMLSVVSNAGHNVHLENMQEYVRQLKFFLAMASG